MRSTETEFAEAPAATLAVVTANVPGPYTLVLTLAAGERRVVDFGPFLRRAMHSPLQATGFAVRATNSVPA